MTLKQKSIASKLFALKAVWYILALTHPKLHIREIQCGLSEVTSFRLNHAVH